MPLSPHEIYEAHRQKFDLYEKLLLKWNQKINLTAITDPKEVRVLHFEDSLAGVAVIKGFFKNVPRGTLCPSSGHRLSDRELRLDGLAKPDPSNTRSLLDINASKFDSGPCHCEERSDEAISCKHLISGDRHASLAMTGSNLNQMGKHLNILDIGSGNGLPGLAIKIALPEIGLTLVESVKKKCDFIKEVVRQLGLQNVEVRHQFLTPKDKMGAFDVVVSRATFDLRNLLEIAVSQIEPGGLVISWKSAKVLIPVVEGFKKIDRIPYELRVSKKLFCRELIVSYS